MQLKILDKEFSVFRLSPDSAIPDWAMKSSFYSITRSIDELSVVCESGLAPIDLKCEAGWRVLQVVGLLDFALTGILSSIASPLADEKISIFAISTFDTDYILVKHITLDQACAVLRSNGFQIKGAQLRPGA
jgi:uncharacterized protein